MRNIISILQVAHRLQSVMACDKVVVMDRGQILEQGEPRSLLAHNSRFAQLHRAQCSSGTL